MGRRRTVAVAILIAAVAALVILLVGRPGPMRGRGQDGGENAAGTAPGEAAGPLTGGGGPGLARGPERHAPRGSRDAEDAEDGGASNRIAPHRDFVRLRVSTVDTATGAPVAAEWNEGGQAFFGNGTVAVTRQIEAWHWGFVACPDGTKDVGVQDRTLNATITPRLPPGWVPLEEGPRVGGEVAAGVEEAAAVIPVCREAVLLVRVFGPDGKPAVGAKVLAMVVAERERKVTCEDAGPGEIRVRGIPFLPGEPVVGALAWQEDEVAPRISLQLCEGIEEAQLVTAVPADADASWTAIVNLTGPENPLVGDFEESYGSSTITDAKPPTGDGPRGSLRVRALGWDGKPAAGVHVGDATTDENGTAAIGDVPACSTVVEGSAPGRFPMQAAVEVREGAVTDVVLREPVGARMEVIVTREDGRHAPFAAIRLGRRVLDVVDGVQRMDALTDHLGRRSFARVEPGETTVTATWGSRRGSERVVLRDGERTVVRILVR